MSVYVRVKSNNVTVHVLHTYISLLYLIPCVTAYGELRSNELYAFAMMDTRKGQPQANGIMPSLLVMDYHVTPNKTGRNKCMLY